MRLFRALACITFAVLAAANACTCEDPPPIDETFDGNIVIGDAKPAPDAVALDRGVDTGPDAASDAEAGDVEPEDGPDEDSGGLDGELDAAMDADVSCTVLATRVLTASAAVAMGPALEGIIVDITGTATVTGVMCTDRECGDAGCCNTCSANVEVDGLLPLLASECFASTGCSGSECGQVCRPAVLGVPQTFRGRVVNPGAVPSLELFSVFP